MLLTAEASAWMQPEATSSAPATAAPSDGGGGGAPPPGCGDPSMLLTLMVMFAIMYFLILRPQQKRQREVDDMLKALRKGDKVRTSGGIKGEIIDLTDNDVTLLVDTKVKLNVLRSHIAARLDKPKPEAKPE